MSEDRCEGARSAHVSKRINMFRVNVYEEAVERAMRVIRSGYIGDGPVVKELESSFAAVSGAPFNVAVNSGTSSLHLGLILAGVSAGDEVVTTAQTMMATSHAILMQRAFPVFADVQFRTGNIDPSDIEHRISNRTKAILVVHWAGYPCDMDEIHAVAQRHGLAVIEDAAHAIGASYKGKPIGSISPITCFSFQAIKHVTSGDGGMLSLLNEEDRRMGSRLRWFGIDRDQRKPSILGEPEWNVTQLGYKYHMNDIAAAIAVGNLGHLREMLEHRRRVARTYREGFAAVPGITLLENRSDRETACWIFTLLAEHRTDLLRKLQGRGIYASVVHLRIDRNDIYGGERRDLPNLDRFTEAHVSLPVHEGMSEDDVQYVIETIRSGW
jgi:perosamine synthetase